MTRKDKISLGIAVGVAAVYFAGITVAGAVKRKREQQAQGAQGVGGYGKAIHQIYNDLQNDFIYGDWSRYPNGERYFRDNMYVTDDGKYIHWENYGASAVRNNLRDLSWLIKTIFDTTPEDFIKDYLKARWEGHRLVVYNPDGTTTVAEDYTELREQFPTLTAQW